MPGVNDTDWILAVRSVNEDGKSNSAAIDFFGNCDLVVAIFDVAAVIVGVAAEFIDMSFSFLRRDDEEFFADFDFIDDGFVLDDSEIAKKLNNF